MQNHIKQTASYLKNLASNYSQVCRISTGVIFATFCLSTAQLNAQNIEMQNSAGKKPTSGKTIDKTQVEETQRERERNGIDVTASLIENLDSLSDDTITVLLEKIKANGFSQLIIHLGKNQTRIIPTSIKANGKERLQTIKNIHGHIKLGTATAYDEDIEVHATANKINEYENINNELKSIDNELKEVESKIVESRKKEGEHYIKQLIRNDGLTLTENAINEVLEALNQAGFGELRISFHNEESLIINTKSPDKNTIKATQDLWASLNITDITADSLTTKEIEKKNGKIEVKVEKRVEEEIPMGNSNDSLSTEKEELLNYDISPYYLKFMIAAERDKVRDRGKRNTPECQEIIDSIGKAFSDNELTHELFVKKQNEYDKCIGLDSDR